MDEDDNGKFRPERVKKDEKVFFFSVKMCHVNGAWIRRGRTRAWTMVQTAIMPNETDLVNISCPRIWKGVSETLQSGRYTLLYPRGRNLSCYQIYVSQKQYRCRFPNTNPSWADEDERHRAGSVYITGVIRNASGEEAIKDAIKFLRIPSGKKTISSTACLIQSFSLRRGLFF